MPANRVRSQTARASADRKVPVTRLVGNSFVRPSTGIGRASDRDLLP